MTSAEDRYRTLLDVLSAVADQPTVKAVLHSLRCVLSSTCPFLGTSLFVLDGDGETLRVFEFDREAGAPPIKTGTRISRIGAVAQALDEQRPVFIPDVAQEMLKHPELLPFAAESVGRPTYIFPVSTPQQRYGVLVVTKDRRQEFAPEDAEMLRSLAAHVAVALECALARDSADHYQRQVALLTFALDNIRDAAFLTDDKARFHYVNQEACRVLGYTRAELLGMSVPDVDLEIPAERWPERWLQLKTQRTLTFEARHRTRDGRIVPVEISGNYFEYGGAAHCLALVKDITERKKAEEALKRSETYLAEAQSLSHTGSWAFDVAGNKYVYLSEECFQIFEIDARGGLPTRETVSRLIDQEDRGRVQGDLERLLREKVDISSEFRIVLPSGATKHLQAVRHPVLNDSGDVVQVVGTVVDITERKQAEEVLRESETRFRVLFDHAADAFCVFDEQHRIVDANREACKKSGYTREELIGMVPQDFDPDIDAALLQEIDDRLAAGEVCTFETRNRRKDGTVFPVEVRVQPFQLGGRRLHLALGRDISERKRAEEERRQSAERFRAVADYTYDWENWVGVDGKLLWVNPAVERMTGYSVAECMAMPDFPIAIVDEADRQAVASQMREAVEGSSRNDFEFRVRRKDGGLTWVAASWQPICDSRGTRLGYRSSMRDIAERKRAEEALRQSEAYLAEGQRLSRTGSWAFDLPSNTYIYVSEEDYRIWGFDPREGSPTGEAVLQRIHPEDRNRWKARFEKDLREKADSSDEYRIVLPDGTIKHIYTIRHPVLNDAGDVVELIGTSVDITERKRAEDELRTSHAELAHERARLSLLLEINNHIVSKLEVDELFQAVAASMRKHFDTDATAFWLINKQTGHLERRFLDFPTGRGFLAKVVATVPSNLEKERWRLRTPQFYGPQETPGLPTAIRDAIKAESLLSRVSVPLVGANGPLGLMHMSSRKPDAFNPADLELLSQIGTQISLALDNALAYGRIRASHDDLQDQRLYLESEISSEFNFEDIVGNSPAIQHVMKQVAIVAPTDSTVLLHGETGTGKELVARAIHRSNPRRERTFVKLNCAAIPSGLLESELFGHEKGAFTGALMQKKGRFELADHGTLFLDEIGDISLELQPKLLRAVQEQEFERLGSTRTIHVNVRIIAATHRDIAAMIRNNQFREDLFYRLNVFPIEIPPLRERPGDIPLLVHYFVSRLSRRMRKNIKTIPKHAMEVLTNAPWPGNVRELENFIERAVILTQGSELNVPITELRSAIRAPSTGSPSTFHDAERQAIIDALKAASGKLAGTDGAAERLGLKRTTLQNKMRRLQITRFDYWSQAG